MPQSLISNLQQVLISKNNAVEEGKKIHEQPPTPAGAHCSGPDAADADVEEEEKDCSYTKPVVLVTNGEGIESPGLTFLIQALLHDARFDIHVCAPQSSVPSIPFPLSFLFLRLVAEKVREKQISPFLNFLLLFFFYWNEGVIDCNNL